jgi:hypothetical protein
MTPEQIKNSLKTQELKLSKSQKFTHYTLVVFFFIIPATLILLHLKDIIKGTPKPMLENEIWFLIIPPILGFLVYLIQKKRLKLKSINTNLTRSEIDKIIENVAKKLEWHFYTKNDNVIIAKTHPSFFSGSWGEQITILFDNKRILVNSICDPDKKSSMVSMGRNKRNRNTLVEEILKASC